MSFRQATALASLLTLLATAEAVGADLGAGSPPMPAPPTGWTVSATPYAWLPFLDGNATVKGRRADINVTPIEVLENLDAIPWMSYIEARRGSFSFYNDIVFAKLGVDVTRTRSLGGLAVDAALGADLSLTIIEVGGTYQVATWSHTAIDLLAGARYWRQELDANLALSGTLNTTGLALTGGRAIARSGSVDWVDPIVGVRLRHNLAPGQDLVLRADIGGFGAGSEFSWNAIGAYSWDIGNHRGFSYNGVLGYRLLSVDYERGSGVTRYEYDVLQHGPFAGLTVRF